MIILKLYKMSLDKIKAIILDMDGVMRIGKQAIPEIHSLLKKIRERELFAMVLTNECRYTEGKIRHDFYDMGIDWPDEWPIYTSAHSVRDFLIKMFRKPNLKNNREIPHFIGVVGEKGLREGVHEAVQVLTEQDELSVRIANLPPFSEQLSDRSELYLIIGTLYNLDITDLEKTLRWIKKGAKVIVSCPDILDPELKGDFSICMPRHILHMIRLNAAGTDYYCVGKPNALMARAIKAYLPEIDFGQILFVGDSLNTDIKLAEENGMVSALVLTGNTKLEELKKSSVQPDLVINTLTELVELL